MQPFEQLFKSLDRERDNYLSRLFGIFSEEIARLWCRCDQAEYEDLGRPMLYSAGVKRGQQLDFTFRHRTSRKTYIVEMKCELAYEGYRYLRLTTARQIEHHRSTKAKAFDSFLEMAANPLARTVKCGGMELDVQGAILLWGATTAEGRDDVMQTYGFCDVLSLETMIGEIQCWQPESWERFVNRYRNWSHELFSFLSGNNLE